MKKLIVIIVALVIFSGITNAQTAARNWGIGVGLGLNQYNGDMGIGMKKHTHYVFGHLFAKRYLTPSFDIGIQGTYGEYGYYQDATQSFRGKKTDAALLLNYKFNNDYFIDENEVLAPYLALGAGFMSTDGYRIKGGSDLIIPFGFGFTFHVCRFASVQYQFLYHFTTSDERDFIDYGRKDHYIQQSLGLVFNLGKSKDSDEDGVVDAKDRCQDSLLGIPVDKNGCPFDRDSDGVADYIDICPFVAGTSICNGCPDADGDGIRDFDDKCPTVRGLAKYFGCPDTDGDDIQDSEDKCPEVAGLAQFSGCPDSDADGVQDSEDKCPTEAGLVALAGCPDRDKDGITDKDDKCPDVYGVKSNNGCPDYSQWEVQSIKFETGSDRIKKESFPIIDNVINILKEHSNYTAEINGHTDNQGDANANQKLSQKRADAVKKYMAKKGITESRMTATGFGETKPIADNKTTEGRNKNRRVVFKIVY